MPMKRDLSDAEDARFRQMRAEGDTWDVIGEAFGIHTTTAREHGIKIGARRPPHGFIRADADPRYIVPLPAGHPIPWGALTAGTCLDGMPYPPRAR